MAIDTTFLKQLDRLELIMSRKVNSAYQGERQSACVGQGLVLKDFAPYSAGDDFRKIDWKVFARTDKLYIKRFEEERNLTVHVLVDLSGSMNYGRKIKKSEYASMIGLGFCYMAMKNNERFILSTFAEKIETFRPRKGRGQLGAAVDYLVNKRSESVTNFEDCITQYHKMMVKSRSMVIIISDFLYPTDQIQNALMRFKDHDIYLIQVLDEQELNLTMEGDFKLVDAETKANMRTFITPYLRKTYQGALEGHISKIKQIATSIRGHYFTVGTDKELFDTFYLIFGGH